MFQVVKIGDKDVEMLAMASVDVYFKQIFGVDPIKMQSSKETDQADIVWLMERMGFVMAKSAELRDRKKMMKLNEESYLDWADQFGRGDLIGSLGYIQSVYDGEKITQVKEKKDIEQ